MQRLFPPTQRRPPIRTRRWCEVEITKDTKVSAILREFGDIAPVMEMFGIKRVSGYTLRRFLTKAITVERAAKIHRVPLDEFLATLRTATSQSPGGDR